ncbi:uncharacterized protein [Rutidosis leptorrhynchoides]|uniref:uncharacterized protein n=1 Tax=Rutidosis leptorrhynchoides TaxID=125765 RepID=UPI003A998006
MGSGVVGKRTGVKFNIINVYDSHDVQSKQLFWDQLHNKILSDLNEPWVVCGDFNKVRSEDERLNCQFIENRAKKFNEFINNTKLIDIPLGGRLFTRVSDDGIKFSKLDRFLVNDSFHNLWSCLSVVALDRGNSDHCPIILKDDIKNFGPKPIKVFDDWLDIEGIDQFINEVWIEDGGGGTRKDCLLRNKLKKTKRALKTKSSQKCGNLEGEIEVLKSIANALEQKLKMASSVRKKGSNGEFLKGCNASFVTLIPNKSDPVTLSDYCPISLIGSFYKIIAKILSNRLRKVIPKLIGSEQSLFLKERYIFDGILIANESIEFLKNHKKQSLIFKVDFEKAFDSLNWHFLLEVMSCMGLEDVDSLAIRMRCQSGKFPFIYLGLQIGSKMKKIGDWSPVIEKFKKRLSEWKMRTLSFGGRLVLLKSVLNSLSLYYFTLFRAPPCVLKLLERNAIENCDVAFKNSFKKSIGDGKNTSFWKENWYGSNCFKEMFPRLYRLESNKDVMISDRIAKVDVSVLSPATCGTVPGSFPATGHVSVPVPAATTGAGSSSSSGAAASICSQTHVQCSTNITGDGGPVSASSQPNVPAGRVVSKWDLANDGVFTVKKLSSLIDKHILGNPIGSKKTLRNNLIPKKIEIFAWRTLKKRIPVRIELDIRGIDLHSVRCPVCDDDLESVDHFIVSCKFASDVWSRIYNWWKLGPCSCSNVDILEGNIAHASTSLGQKIWKAVVWVCAYYLWKNRNLKVFHNESWCTPVLVSEIQVKSFEWITGRIKGKKIDWPNWLVNPHMFLNL